MTPRNLSLPFGLAAIDQLLRDHPDEPRIGPACALMGYYGEIRHQPTLDLLRAVSETQHPTSTARVTGDAGPR